MFKFPKTPRISYILQNPDTYKDWNKLTAVVQEKVDGSNVGVSFDQYGSLLLQSKSRYLTGDPCEAEFDLFKMYASGNEELFFDVLQDKYILFGEWLYAKHRVFYDNLPSYLLAYDLYDKEEEKFLCTARVKSTLQRISVNYVPVLHTGRFDKINNFSQYIAPTQFKTKKWKEKLVEVGGKEELKHTDISDLMEGIYVRIEDESWVLGRVKHPRSEFSKVHVDDSDWMKRPIIPNILNNKHIVVSS